MWQSDELTFAIPVYGSIIVSPDLYKKWDNFCVTL